MALHTAELDNKLQHPLAVSQVPAMKRLALVLVVGSALMQLCCGQQAFLQRQLPLKVLLATPSELASEGATAAAQAVTLTGRQAITVRLRHISAAVTARLGLERA
jgi:hypothetical protein